MQLNALIVSFCTHARNLLEFFFRPRKSRYTLASDYAEPSYKRLDSQRADVKRLYAQLCQQLNHLSHDPSDDSAKKIGPLQRQEVIKLIHDEAVRLEKKLISGFDRKHLVLEELGVISGASIAPGAGGASIISRSNDL